MVVPDVGDVPPPAAAKLSSSLSAEQSSSSLPSSYLLADPVQYCCASLLAALHATLSGDSLLALNIFRSSFDSPILQNPLHSSCLQLLAFELSLKNKLYTHAYIQLLDFVYLLVLLLCLFVIVFLCSCLSVIYSLFIVIV